MDLREHVELLESKVSLVLKARLALLVPLVPLARMDSMVRFDFTTASKLT